MKPNIVLLGIFGLTLAGCNTMNPTLVTTKNVVYVPPSSLFNCPLAPLPQSFSSDVQVAQTLNTTYGNNRICHNNMQSLHNDLLNQKKTFGGK